MSEDTLIVLFLFFVVLFPPLVLLVIGIILRSKGNKSARIFFILTGLWFVFLGVIFLIGLGVCGAL